MPEEGQDFIEFRSEQFQISWKILHLSQGKHEIIKAVRGFKYPLKIVVYVERDTVTVITNYPLKKGRKK